MPIKIMLSAFGILSLVKAFLKRVSHVKVSAALNTMRVRFIRATYSMTRQTISIDSKIRVLFIGDSYFEFFNFEEFAGKNRFKDYFPED